MLCFRVRGLGFSRVCEVLGVSGLGLTYSLHCTSFFGLTNFILRILKVQWRLQVGSFVLGAMVGLWVFGLIG